MFKLWLENEELVDWISKLNADSLYSFGLATTTFVYLQKPDKLLCGTGLSTHGEVLRKYNLSYTGSLVQQLEPSDRRATSKFHGIMNPNERTAATFGRFGRLDNKNHHFDLDASDYYMRPLTKIIKNNPGTGVVVLYESWNGLQLYNNLLNKTIKKLLNTNNSDIIGVSPADLPITEDYYVVSDIVPVYQISGFKSKQTLSDIDNQIKRMAGELHFLPASSPRRQEIYKFASDLNTKSDKHKYKWFLDMVLNKPKSHKNPWQSSAEKAGIVKMGQRLFNVHSENYDIDLGE